MPSWEAIEKSISDQKMSEALKGTLERLDLAKAKLDETEQARALVKATQLQIALQEFETAVDHLRSEPWPKAALPRATVGLFYAQSLMTYAEAYYWQIPQQQIVASRQQTELKRWTLAQTPSTHSRRSATS